MPLFPLFDYHKNRVFPPALFLYVCIAQLCRNINCIITQRPTHSRHKCCSLLSSVTSFNNYNCHEWATKNDAETHILPSIHLLQTTFDISHNVWLKRFCPGDAIFASLLIHQRIYKQLFFGQL